MPVVPGNEGVPWRRPASQTRRAKKRRPGSNSPKQNPAGPVARTAATWRASIPPREKDYNAACSQHRPRLLPGADRQPGCQCQALRRRQEPRLGTQPPDPPGAAGHCAERHCCRPQRRSSRRCRQRCFALARPAGRYRRGRPARFHVHGRRLRGHPDARHPVDRPGGLHRLPLHRRSPAPAEPGPACNGRARADAARNAGPGADLRWRRRCCRCAEPGDQRAELVQRGALRRCRSRTLHVPAAALGCQRDGQDRRVRHPADVAMAEAGARRDRRRLPVHLHRQPGRATGRRRRPGRQDHRHPDLQRCVEDLALRPGRSLQRKLAR